MPNTLLGATTTLAAVFLGASFSVDQPKSELRRQLTIPITAT